MSTPKADPTKPQVKTLVLYVGDPDEDSSTVSVVTVSAGKMVHDDCSVELLTPGGNRIGRISWRLPVKMREI